MEENLKNIKKNSLNKTWLLVTGLIILTIILLVVSLTSKNFPLNRSSNQNIKTDFAHTSLTFSEEPRPSSASGTYEVDLNIDTNDNNVQDIQLELVFDPKILTKVDIRPGSFLTSPNVLIKKIDTATGRITLALGNKPEKTAVKGKGVVAVVSFSKTGNAQTVINFLPHTKIAAPGFNQSVLKETVSAVIGTLPSFSPETQTIISPEKTRSSQ